MPRWMLFCALAAGCLAFVITPAISNAKEKDKEEAHEADLAKEAKVTIEQAIKTASQKVTGTIVEAELEKEHGKTIWEVEIVGSDGTVSEVHIDAVSGEVIDVEKEDEKKKEGKKRKK